jgi:hypothetical protein
VDIKRQYFKVSPIGLIRKVYDFSRPQGLGFLHYKESGLTAEEAQSCIFDEGMLGIAIHMDYVAGRACKFHAKIDKELGVGFFTDDWYDHSASQLENLVQWAKDNTVCDEQWQRFVACGECEDPTNNKEKV